MPGIILVGATYDHQFARWKQRMQFCKSFHHFRDPFFPDNTGYTHKYFISICNIISSADFCPRK